MAARWKEQVLIESPIDHVWELVGDPNRHPEWWPRVVEVKGLGEVEEDAAYRQTTRNLGSEMETTMRIEQLEDLRRIHVRCEDTGTYARWLLTEAQGSTFAEVEIGMEPSGVSNRIFSATVGKRYFRRWTALALDGLRKAAR